MSVTYINKSSIHEDGLFAATAIPANSIIIEYTGPEIDSMTTVMDHENVYVRNDGSCINGNNDARFINDIIDLRQLTYAETKNFFTKKEIPKHTGYEYNCKFYEYGDRILVISTRDIKPHEELFIEYGFNYWFSIFIRKSLIDYNYKVTSWSS
jgi:SET domain-containing protein